MELNTQLIGNEQRLLARLFSAGVVFEDVGEWIGPYCLLERLGEGGFGTVWRAEQTVPVTREVALKVIKRGMDTRQVLARFDHERQSLANMDHPYIAAMLDAGASADGRPYFAMELVTGTTITEWCEKLRSPIHERLRLFILVCHAVNHAHQRGIIHRDLKPSNILVTSMDGVPTPKIIDFGIAKAISAGNLEEVSLLTQADQLIGTPLYMSPEQIDGSHVLDTRSDIYALGVLLYELLTGTPPFHSSSTGSSSIEALKRCIREDVPTRPSTLIQKRKRLVGHQPAIEPSFDHKQLGYAIDLDWIAMRALEKNPAQRYQSSVEFADDIQRFLNNEPILARPPHFAYLASRWIRRNRVVFAASCAVVLALITATIVSVREANLAMAARTFAEKQTALAKASEARAASEAQRAQQTAAFLTELLDRVSAQIDRGRNPEALRAALVDSEKRIKALSDDANLQLQLLKRVADVYSRIGETKQLIPLLKAYAEVSAKLNGPTSNTAFIDELNYLKTVIDHGNRSTAPRLLLDLRNRIEAATQAGSKPWLDTQRQLIRTYTKLLQPAQALASADYFINTLQNQKHSKKVLLSTIVSCIQAYEIAGDFAKATELLNQCVELNKEVKDEKLAVHIVIQQINLCKSQKEFERGAVILRSEIAKLKAKHGDQSPEVFEKIIELVGFERSAQDITNALKHGQEALAIARAKPSNRDALAYALESVAMTESSARDYATAIRDAQEAYTIAKLSGKASAIHHCLATLAEINSNAGHLEEAASYYQLQLQRVEAERANYKERINVMQNIRTVRTKQGRLDEAMKLNEALWTVLSEEPESKNEPSFVADVAKQCLSTYEAFKTTKPDEIEPKIVVVWQEASNKSNTSKSQPTVIPSATK